MSQPDWTGKAEIFQHTIAVTCFYPCMLQLYIPHAVIIAVLITLWKDLEM